MVMSRGCSKPDLEWLLQAPDCLIKGINTSLFPKTKSDFCFGFRRHCKGLGALTWPSCSSKPPLDMIGAQLWLHLEASWRDLLWVPSADENAQTIRHHLGIKRLLWTESVNDVSLFVGICHTWGQLLSSCMFLQFISYLNAISFKFLFTFSLNGFSLSANLLHVLMKCIWNYIRIISFTFRVVFLMSFAWINNVT